MKSILVLVFNDLRHDARVARQIDFLSTHGPLTIVCFDAPATWSHEIMRIPRIKPGFWIRGITAALLLLRAYPLAYRLLYGFPSLANDLRKRPFDLIVANDIECLPLACQIRQHAKILFDAHEYAPRHFEDKWVWRIFFQRFNVYLCRTYLPQADAMTTVGEGLATEYAKHFSVHPEIITNANYYHDVKPSPVVPGKIRLVHHGAANPSRQLELMIRMMDFLDERFELTLILLVPTLANPKTRSYLDALRASAERNPRITFMPAVGSHEVINAIHPYDAGVFLLPPVNFNYANTLPNKFFDFIQARLMVAIGPTPEMKRLVETHDLGVVAEDFTPEALARKLNALREDDISKYKQHAHEAAHLLSAENNRTRLNALVIKLLNE